MYNRARAAATLELEEIRLSPICGPRKDQAEEAVNQSENSGRAQTSASALREGWPGTSARHLFY